MLEWLKRVFGRASFGEYPRRERDIFAYHDGLRPRRGDPLAIQRALLAADDLRETAQVADVPTAEGRAAQGELVVAVRRAFGVPAFESGGLLDVECLELFVRFSDFVKRLEADARPLSSSPTPTDCPASA